MIGPSQVQTFSLFALKYSGSRNIERKKQSGRWNFPEERKIKINKTSTFTIMLETVHGKTNLKFVEILFVFTGLAI